LRTERGQTKAVSYAKLFWDDYILEVPIDNPSRISMSDLGKTSSEHLAINTLRKTLTFLGILFFLFSLIFPFYYER